MKANNLFSRTGATLRNIRNALKQEAGEQQGRDRTGSPFDGGSAPTEEDAIKVAYNRLDALYNTVPPKSNREAGEA